DHNVEIANPELKICTLTEDLEIGTIPVDSIFSPVHRVRYAIENTRVGKSTDYDRLVLEIWTDGTVSPEMALVEASKIYRKHLNPFVQYFEFKEDLAVEGGVLAPEGDEGAKRREMADLLSKSVDMLELSVRAKNCLDSENITVMRDLVRMTEPELLKVRNFGKTSLKEVKSKLSALGLSLGINVDEYH
ncbi:MAG: DNA-directed RNA polymerase subunit alpha, partial [Planctomycetes bacterium]|nr:DNA-directed RNA polymerase subunit alpha [Planctomycetota bacterium]